jgi:cytochrome P450
MTSLFDPAIADDPFDFYAEKHAARCPVHFDDHLDQHVVLGFGEAREVLNDPSKFSSVPARMRGIDPAVAMAYANEMTTKGWGRAATLQRTDPPAHTRYRRLLGKVFTPRRVKELTPRIDELAHQLIDAFVERGRCEFVGEFALPLPGIIIAEQLGLDASQYLTFKKWADAMLATAQRPKMTVDEAIAIAQVELEAQHFLADVFEDRRVNPTDDLISALVHSHGEDDEPLTIEELQSLMHQLVTGGFETTTSAIGHGLWHLIEHPDQMAKLRSDQSLLPNAIEEILRFDSPVQGLWRRTACPASVAGSEIDEQRAVMVRFGAANRDPRMFEDPDRFDITRADAKNHIAFGFGVHFCVGAALARQELMSSFTAVLDRLDNIELAEPLESPAHEYSVFLRPLKALLLSFTAR